MGVAATEPIAVGPDALAFVILPNLVVDGFARRAPQRMLAQDCPFVVGVQLDKTGLFVAIPTIGKDDEDLPLHRIFLRPPSDRAACSAIGLPPRFNPGAGIGDFPDRRHDTADINRLSVAASGF
jgi:hypothetical protein